MYYLTFFLLKVHDFFIVYSILKDLYVFFLMARSFSEDLKWRVVFLYHDGHKRKKIAELLHISKATVDKVLQIYVQWETVVNPWQKLPGRHKTLTRDEMKVICE